MKVVCAWRKKVLTNGIGEVSHGICDECAVEFKKEVDDFIKEEK